MNDTRVLKTKRKEKCEELADDFGVEIEDERPAEGELYIAGGNMKQLRFLEAERVDEDIECVFPKGDGYPFDLSECFRLTDEYQ